MIDNSCAFTGHRPHKFPWRYDETDSRCVALKAALTEQITALVEIGITDFFSGCADGVDCWAALIVLELRKKNPALKLMSLSLLCNTSLRMYLALLAYVTNFVKGLEIFSTLQYNAVKR